MTNKKIIIIGGGFCGMMTAVYLLRLSQPVDIVIINDGYPFGRGVAYSAHTDTYLLNVRAINMSAFEDDRNHFLNWLQLHPSFQHIPNNILANVYAPRKIYGDYLQHAWQQAVKTKNPPTRINIIQQKAVNIKEYENGLGIYLDNNKILQADFAVLATGNTVPRHINVQNKSFLNSNKYFANPWTKESIDDVRHLKQILIVGNGLTMVDTVLGILENGFKGIIYTISPNGFKLVPHKYNLLVYDKIIEELPEANNLHSLFLIIRRHIKALTDVGIGAHLVIDALRPYTRNIWQSFSLSEKKFFIKRLSHGWSILRHRLPMHIYEIIHQLRMQQRMITIAGRIKNITETPQSAAITYIDNKQNKEATIYADRVINCTGPETDIQRSANELLKNIAGTGMITADVLKLGIEADVITGAVINSEGNKSKRIYTTGSNLKGVLWENTAVPDIRIQVQQLAQHIASMFKETVYAD